MTPHEQDTIMLLLTKSMKEG